MDCQICSTSVVRPASRHDSSDRLRESCRWRPDLQCKDAQYDKWYDKRVAWVSELLPNLPKEAIKINTDPRGYALKIEDSYVKEQKLDIHRDWGGYGILAPDFS